MRTPEEIEFDRKATTQELAIARTALHRLRKELELLENCINSKEELIDILVLNCDHNFEKEVVDGKVITQHCVVCGSTVFRRFK